MQVNGAASGDDVFSIGAGSVGRIDFDRTSPGPFSLNIGTVESLIVNGLGGNDTFTIGQQPVMPNPLAVSLNGQDGNDTFSLTSPVGPTSGAPLSVSINGGSAAGSLGNDVVNLEAPVNRSPVFTYQAIATGGVMVSGFMPTAVNITATERVVYDGSGNDAVTVIGTANSDLLSVRPTSANSANVFLGGTSPGSPGSAGGGLSPDLILSGIGVPLNIDGSTPTGGSPGDRLAYLGNGTLTSTGADGGTISNNANFIPVHFTGIESISGLTPVLNGGSQAFSSPTSYEVGTAPRAVATGDVNNDGFIDMVLANTGSNTVSILLGTGDGTFLPATSRFSGGLKPVALTLGDFTGDGNLDIAVVNRGSNTVNILNGTGTGTFRPGAIVTVAEGANAIEAGNLDNDADLDLAVTSAATNQVNILLNAGVGVFATAVQVPTRG